MTILRCGSKGGTVGRPVSLKHDGTDGTATTDGTGATGHKSYRFAAKINLTALTQTSHEVVTHASEQRASLQLNFYFYICCPICFGCPIADGTDGPSPVSRLFGRPVCPVMF